MGGGTIDLLLAWRLRQRNEGRRGLDLLDDAFEKAARATSRRRSGSPRSITGSRHAAGREHHRQQACPPATHRPRGRHGRTWRRRGGVVVGHFGLRSGLGRGRLLGVSTGVPRESWRPLTRPGGSSQVATPRQTPKLHMGTSERRCKNFRAGGPCAAATHQAASRAIRKPCETPRRSTTRLWNHPDQPPTPATC